MFGWLRRLLGTLPRESPDSPFTVITRPDGSKALVDAPTLSYMESTAPDPTQASLEELLAGLGSVRVYREGVAREKLLGDAPIATVDTPAALDEFKEVLRIVDGPAGHCMCFGDPSLELLDPGGERLALIAVHHGLGIRWRAWKDDAQLADGVRLLEWLARHSVEYPLAAFRETEADAERAQAAFERWVVAAPPCLSDLVLEFDEFGDPARPDVWATAVQDAYPEKDQRALALLAWHGSGCGPWSGYPAYETAVEKLIEGMSTSSISEAIGAPGVSDAQLEGAARYLAGRCSREQRDQVPLALRKRLVEQIEGTGDEDKIVRVRKLLGEKA